jgi:probable HAF family extracellular repeat protein
MQELGSFGGNFSRAYDVSEDGNYVVGWAYNSNGDQRAFRWDVQTGAMEDLGTLGGAESIAFAVSDDGRYVVGNAQKADGFWHAFRWDAQTGIMQSLGTLGGQESFAHGIAADGNYVVGAAQLPNGSAHAFRWSEHNNNMIDLGTLGNPPGTARDISEDGNYVVGESRNNNFEWRAFRWVSASNTLEDLNITFATLLDNGSVLHYARSITPNGRFIVGKGFNAATGREEAYLLDALSLVTSVEPTAETPRNFELFQNYPNPFNPVTALRYQLPVGGDVQLTIYDILGRKVRSLVHQRQSAGQYLVRWDGTNDAGEPVSSGVYLYRLTVNRTNGNPFVKTRKMVLLK